MNPKLMFPGLKEVRLPLRRQTARAAAVSLLGAARALFQAPDATTE